MDSTPRNLGSRLDRAERWRRISGAIHIASALAVAAAVLVPRFTKGLLLPPEGSIAISGRAGFAYVPIVLVIAWPLLASWVAAVRNPTYGSEPPVVLAHVFGVALTTAFVVGLQFADPRVASMALTAVGLPILQALVLVLLGSRGRSRIDV